MRLGSKTFTSKWELEEVGVERPEVGDEVNKIKCKQNTTMKQDNPSTALAGQPGFHRIGVWYRPNPSR